MEHLSTSELLEVVTYFRTSFDDQFQYWLAITFAFLVACFSAGDRLSRSWRTLASALYLLTSTLFLYRLVVDNVIAQAYLQEAVSRGAFWQTNFVGLVRMGIMFIGSLATIAFIHLVVTKSNRDT